MFCHFYNQPQGSRQLKENTFKGFRKTSVLEEGTTEGEDVVSAASRPPRLRQPWNFTQGRSDGQGKARGQRG